MKKFINKIVIVMITLLLFLIFDKNNVSQAASSYYIKVNYGANVVTVYESNGTPVKSMVCSCGTATPKSGTYKLDYKYRWLSLVGGVHGQYCTRIVGNILFHSVPYLQSGNPGSLEYWEYDKLGTTASAGCIRLTVEDAKWIYENCSSGTSVEFFSSSDVGPLGKPETMKISNSVNKNWDPTDPDSRNPWKSYDMVFDYRYYADNNSDLKAAFGYDEALLRNHFLTFGINENRKTIRTFDVCFYKNYHKDLRNMSNIEAIRHYIIFGISEGRLACIPDEIEKIMFDYKYYADNNKDLKNVFGYDKNLLREHWYRFGFDEGRKSSELFNVKDYLSYNHDLSRAFNDNCREGIKHFIIFGFKEGRKTSETFDVKAYRNNNNDLNRAFGDNYMLYFKHYLEFGKNEGRITI